MIVDTMYSNKEDGLCGNDDAGQMSAWYIFSTLGFYPVNPGSTKYSIGSPSVQSAIISLENGKKFTIKTVNQSSKNVYLSKIKLNGKNISTLTIDHDDIENGSELIFYMGAKPNKKLTE
jgi:putative alpha-1,2-mannosidase